MLKHLLDRFAAKPDVQLVEPFRAIPDPIARADAIRQFVYDHTTHGRTVSDQSPWDPASCMLALHHYVTGKSVEKPKLTCGPRARLMKVLCEQVHIPCRLVHLYSFENEDIRSHTFVEVQTKGQWTIQDPDYNWIYLDANDVSRRLSALDLMTAPEHVEILTGNRPINTRKSKRAQQILNEYLGAVKIDDPSGAPEKSMVYVHPERYNPNKRFAQQARSKARSGDNGNSEMGISFPMFVRQYYGDIPIVEAK